MSAVEIAAVEGSTTWYKVVVVVVVVRYRRCENVPSFRYPLSVTRYIASLHT